jgi:hypothetical protein
MNLVQNLQMERIFIEIFNEQIDIIYGFMSSLISCMDNFLEKKNKEKN